MWNQGSIQKDDGSKYNKMFGRWGAVLRGCIWIFKRFNFL